MNAVAKIATLTPATSRKAVLETLAAQWEDAKGVEAEAANKRRAIEMQIAGLVDDGSIEGTQTADLGDVKIKVTRSLNRKVDVEALSVIAQQIPDAIFNRLVKTKLEVDTRELRFIEANEPELYLIVAKAITTTPAKPSIKVER